MTTRRDILKGGAGLAAILASGKAPAYLVKSMLASRIGIGVPRGGGAPADKYWGLCLTAEEAGSTVGMEAVGTAPSISLQYSTNGKDWDDFIVGTTSVTLTNVGDIMYMRAGPNGNICMGKSTSRYNHFIMTGKIAASGDITSLLNRDTPQDYPSDTFALAGLFRGCTSLTEPPELNMTQLTYSNVYRDLFNGCSSLRHAPVLPCKSVGNVSYFYGSMFYGCTSITKAQILLETIA
ncbi:MAG: hypothetical protein IIW14_09825, partial [Kiritimatiellae bacterium]|nr:hypothetical protein [Kiritimatiellia bacterium]